MDRPTVLGVELLQTLLMPVGWVVTFLVLYYGDRLLDRHVKGSGRKRPGVIPFWWTFVLAVPLGWGTAMVTGDSPYPSWAQVVVLVVLSLVAVAAFCARFGLRLRR